MIKSAIDIIGRNLLPAIAYGDAAGLPVETRDAAYIRDWYGSVNALLRTTENPFYKGEYEAGTWSDDTQLSLAVARSVIKANGFDMQALADEHVAAYGTTPQVTKENGQVVVRGWGRSTTLAVQRYMRGIPIEACGQKNGAGNGVVMKMAPLALLYIALETDKAEAYRHLDACTQFTHDSLVAKVASRVHYDALNYLVRHPLDQAEFGHHVYSSAVYHEGVLNEGTHDTSTALQYLAKASELSTKDILEHTDGKGFYVPQTLSMVYGAFLAHHGEFAPSVYEAVNLGGDTDSTASIVAAMSVFGGANGSSFPCDFPDVMQYSDLCETSNQLVKTIHHIKTIHEISISPW